MNNLVENHEGDMNSGHKKKSKSRSFWMISIGLGVIFVALAGYLAIKILEKKFPNSFVASFSPPKKRTFAETFNDKANKKIEEAGTSPNTPT